MTRHVNHLMNMSTNDAGYGPPGRGPRPGGRGRNRHRGQARGPWDDDEPRNGWNDEPSMGLRHADARGPHHAGPGRRGDVRQAALRVIAEQPSTGYQVIATIADKSQGLWKPGPGSVYPALQALADEGLVRCEETDGGKKVYTITEDGSQRLAEHPGGAPWERMTRDMAGTLTLRPALAGLRGAVMQAAQVGTEAQRARVEELLKDTRRKVYLILASDDEPEPDEA